MKVSTLIATTGLAFAAGLGLVTPASAVDFNCTEARNAAECTICDSPQLSRLDDGAARLYGLVWNVASTSARYRLRDDQRDFLDRRNACGASAVCIRSAYRDRMDELRTALRSESASLEPRRR